MRITIVSILVVLDLGLELFFIITPCCYYMCFNPCCIGFRFRTFRNFKCPIIDNMVSILVVLDLGLEQNQNRQRKNLGEVSILVVLDLGLEPHAPAIFPLMIRCFNPCCIGFRFRTL